MTDPDHSFDIRPSRRRGVAHTQLATFLHQRELTWIRKGDGTWVPAMQGFPLNGFTASPERGDDGVWWHVYRRNNAGRQVWLGQFRFQLQAGDFIKGLMANRKKFYHRDPSLSVPTSTSFGGAKFSRRRTPEEQTRIDALKKRSVDGVGS